MNKAVFLDRDGVLNKERRDYVKFTSELEIYENISECIKKLKNGGFKVIVVTNQSAINRKLTNHENINEIHNTIQEYLKIHGTKIDGFYYCPHKPDEDCFCRKPKPGMLQAAAEDLEIDLKSSWMIGDNDTDVIAGENAGCKSVKIMNNFELVNTINNILNDRLEIN
jgi:histidinol-phosphate phosphatase family protein